MAGNKIDVELSVNDSAGTLKRRNAEAKELSQNLTSAARMAERAMKPVASKYQASGEGTEYGRARGSMGSTGASARDFANQAQGLGGLVRVYATVAANLFAVSAAFNALKEAANTTNMIKGLDQLGAVSGVALGSLSKRLVEATDGAISLREAVSTVAKASASGLNSKQIIEIGQYAKVASQALGLDMSDAVSRLTRGITKLEPELLDELGLFTKIGDATQAYALKLGKTTTSLTDFERRQAFANAVLLEAKNRFGELNIGANPYQRLEASIRNLASSGLQLVNSVLIPIVNLFSNNQAALVVGLGLIATKLTTMAIPALIGWRTELVRAAKEAKDKSKEITEAFGEKFTERTGIKLNIPQLQQNLDEAKRRVTKSQQDLLDVQKQYGMRTTKTISAAAAGTFGQDPKDFSRAQAQIASLMDKNTPKSLAQAAALEMLVDETKKLTIAQNNLNKAFETQDKYASSGDIGEYLRRRASKRAASRAERLTILSEISADTEAGGFGYAIDRMNEKIRKSVDMGIFAKLRTTIVGTFTAGIASIGVFTRAVGNLGAIIGAITTVATVLKSIFTETSKESEIFSSAITGSKEAVKTSIAVMDRYAKSISTESLAAKANSIRELGLSVEQLANSFNKVNEKAGRFDKIWEGLLDVLPGVNSQFEDFSESVGSNLAQQLAMIPEGPARKALEDKLTTILGAKDLTEKGIREAVKKAGRKKASSVVEAANAALLADRNKIDETGVKAQQFAEKVKSANEEASKLIQSLSNTDPLSKFGEGLVRMGADFQEASKDVNLSIATLKETLKDPKALSLVSPESIVQLRQIQETLPKLNNTVASGSAELTKVKDEVTRLQALKDKFRPGSLVKFEDTTSGKALTAAKSKERSLAEEIGKSQTEIEKLQRELRKIAVLAIEEGYKLMQAATERAVRQGGINLQKNLLQGLTGPEITSAQAELDRQSLAIQREQITETTRLAETMLKSNALAESRLAWDQAQSMKQEAKTRGNGTIDADTQERIDYLVKKSSELSLLGTAGTLKGSKLKATDLTPEAQGVNLQLLSAKEGSAVKLAENAAAVALNKQQEALQVAQDNRTLDNERQASLDKLASTNREIQLIELSTRDILTDSELSVKNRLQSEQQLREQSASRKVLEDQIAGIQDRINISSGKQLVALTEQKQRTEGKLKLLTDQQNAENRLLATQQKQAEIANIFAIQKRELELINERRRLELDISSRLISSESELLSKKADLGLLTEKAVFFADLELQKQAALKQAEADRFNAKVAYDTKLIELAKQLAAAGSTPEAIADYNRLSVEAKNAFDAQVKAIDTINSKKLEGIGLEEKLGYEGKQYAKVLATIPDGLTDAFMKFAETGKRSFKDFANSMIADLARIALRAQMTNVMTSLLGQDFANKAANLLSAKTPLVLDTGGLGLGGPDGGTANLNAEQFRLLKSAKGNVFDVGLQKFAQGGAFTNSIVNNPTLFKFAQGTGLMGEVGPEAIMPLKRDSNGNLGVRATKSEPQTTVVVNNYSGEKATARETTDSNGNRKIEVIVGEIVAGEINRSGSAAQQAIGGTFGQRPAVVRR